MKLKKIPCHIGIVMDGNGRWAKERKLPRLMGHRAGTENTRRVLKACGEFGIKMVTLYGFSTENWQRPKYEVNGLFSIFEDAIDREVPELHRNGVRLRHVGKQYLDNSGLKDRTIKDSVRFDLALFVDLGQAGLRALDKMEVYLLILNLFDKEYETYGYYDPWGDVGYQRYYTPGAARHFLVGVNYDF